MLKRGYNVTAVDISQNMIDIVREKARKEGLLEHLTTYRSRASELGRIAKEMEPGYFSGCYSTYGALNCEPFIKRIPEPLHDLISGKGYFIAGVYNRFCMAETIMHVASLNPAGLLWRIRRFVPEGHSRFCIDVYSYSVHEFVDIFRSEFVPVEVKGIPVILPPSNFTRALKFVDRKIRTIDYIDRRIGRKWPFKYLGDHFLIVLKNQMK